MSCSHTPSHPPPSRAAAWAHYLPSVMTAYSALGSTLLTSSPRSSFASFLAIWASVDPTTSLKELIYRLEVGYSCLAFSLLWKLLAFTQARACMAIACIEKITRLSNPYTPTCIFQACILKNTQKGTCILRYIYIVICAIFSCESAVLRDL